MERETRFFEEKQVTLDCPGRGLELLAQPTAGNLSLLHEDPEDLPQTDQFRLRILVASHRPSLLYNHG
jgi:hypothetical protein